MMYNLKKGDKVVLDNQDTNIYEVDYYHNLMACYVTTCGRYISGLLILRLATKDEILVGYRL